MVWGCFTKDRIGPLVEVSDKIIGSIYINMLENTFLLFYNSFENNLQYIFQDDNVESK